MLYPGDDTWKASVRAPTVLPGEGAIQFQLQEQPKCPFAKW